MLAVIAVGIFVAVAIQPCRDALYRPQDGTMIAFDHVADEESDVILGCPTCHNPVDLRCAQVVAPHDLPWVRDHVYVGYCYDWRDLATASEARTCALWRDTDPLAHYAGLDDAARGSIGRVAGSDGRGERS